MHSSAFVVLAGAGAAIASLTGSYETSMAPGFSALFERQTRVCKPVPPPLTCERSCGPGYITCISLPTCYNPGKGDVCCSDGCESRTSVATLEELLTRSDSVLPRRHLLHRRRLLPQRHVARRMRRNQDPGHRGAGLARDQLAHRLADGLTPARDDQRRGQRARDDRVDGDRRDDDGDPRGPAARHGRLQHLGHGDGPDGAADRDGGGAAGRECRGRAAAAAGRTGRLAAGLRGRGGASDGSE